MAVKEKIRDTRMIPVCSETMNKARNWDIMNMKIHKKQLIFNKYVIVIGSSSSTGVHHLFYMAGNS